MPRKYQGPLRPGEKSAYVKGTRTQVYYRKPKGSKKKKVPRKVGPAAPKGLATSVMKKISELKIRTLDNKYNIEPQPQAIGAGATPIVYYTAYCLGQAATTWLGPNGNLNTGFKELSGYQYPNGTGADQRVGKYMFLKQCTANLRIQMNSTSRASCPTRFRVVVFKAIRNAQVGTTGGNPFDRLFVSNSGLEKGINTSFSTDSVSMEFMNMITNKKNFKIYKDQQFILQNPLTTVQGSTSIVSPMSQCYPAEKNLSFTFRHNRKTAFDEFNQPSDINYQYCVMILACPSGGINDVQNNGWVSSMRGTVSAYDN